MTNPFRQLKHENPLPLFNERKATEAAAFFLLKARGSLDCMWKCKQGDMNPLIYFSLRNKGV